MRRRQFLATCACAIGSRTMSQSLLSAEPKTTSLSPQEFQRKIVGPILSVPTCFRQDLTIDHEGMKRVVELGIRSGCRIVTLTAGNNQYDILTDDEIRELTKKMREAVNGRAIFISAAGKWETAQTIDYARFAHQLGADALQVTLPKLDDDRMLQHMHAVAAATPLGLILHGDPPISLLKRLMAIESIVGFKEEYTTIYSLQLYREFGQRLTLFAGGEKARLLTYYPYGMRAWYSTFMTFVPSVAIQFQKAVEAGDLRRAGEVILQYETPVFQRFSLPFWRATLEHFGLASRWSRGPEKSFTNDQMVELASFYEGLGLKTSPN